MNTYKCSLSCCQGFPLYHTLTVRGKGLFFFSPLSHFLLQETDRPSDVSGGPVSASQPEETNQGRLVRCETT